MCEKLWPDVRLMPEVSEDSFVRAGVTDFDGQPWLFVSEYRDLDALQGDGEFPEGFFLVRIPEGDFEAFHSRYLALHAQTNDPEWEKKAKLQFNEWWRFRTRVLAEAVGAVRVERNFLEVYLADIGEAIGPVADSGWVRRAEVNLEEMRMRLRWAEERLCGSFGEPEAIRRGDELPF